MVVRARAETREVVVITGASAGVGRATARAFASRGASIGLIARGLDRLEATAREVEQRGGRALILQLDVADAARVEDAARRVEDAFGPIDVWVNNAMTTVFAAVKDTTAWASMHRGAVAAATVGAALLVATFALARG